MLLIVAMLAILLASSALLRPWRGEVAVRDFRRIMNRAWPYPHSWLVAVSRGYFVMVVGLFLAGVGLLVKKFTVHGSPSGRAPNWAQTLAYVGACVFAVAFCLSLAIALINRPRFLVPRGMRGEPGFLQVVFQGLFDRVRSLWRPRR